jgi:hypothetical protein
MAIPSRVLSAGNAPLSTEVICGDVANTLTATGSTITDALQLSAVINNVTTTASSTGVKLPPAETGAQVVVFNNGANSLTVYALTGSTVDAGASVAIATGKERIFFGISPTVWLSHLGA